MQTFSALNQLALRCTLNAGPPHALHLELRRPNNTVTTVALGDAELIAVSSLVYEYQVLPTDLELGTWWYRWRGLDINDLAFAAPVDARWASFHVV